MTCSWEVPVSYISLRTVFADRGCYDCLYSLQMTATYSFPVLHVLRQIQYFPCWITTVVDTVSLKSLLRTVMNSLFGIVPILLRYRMRFSTALVPRLQFWLSSLGGVLTLRGRPAFNLAVGITRKRLSSFRITLLSECSRRE